MMNDSLTDIFHFGMVEDRHSDPLKLGRVRVRILGLHTENLDDLPTKDLPLATVMLPSNMAAMGGTGYSPTGVIEGTWCVLVFADEYKQQPIIIGTIGGIPQPVINADGSGTGTTSNAVVNEPCPADVKADTPPANNDALPKLMDNITGCDKAGKDAIKDEEKCASTVPGIKRGQLPKWCKSTDPDSTPIYAYPDSGGVWTIGYGYTQGIGQNSTSTKGEADKKFDSKLAPYEAATKRLVKVPLTQGQFNAVCSMVYNGGEGNIGNSAFLKELNAGRYESAAAMIPDTVNTVKGVKNQGLVNRRIREQKMFLSSGTPTYEGSTVIASSEATCPLTNVEEVYESAPGIPVKGGVIKSGQAAGVVQTTGGGSSGSSGAGNNSSTGSDQYGPNSLSDFKQSLIDSFNTKSGYFKDLGYGVMKDETGNNREKVDTIQDFFKTPYKKTDTILDFAMYMEAGALPAYFFLPRGTTYIEFSSVILTDVTGGVNNSNAILGFKLNEQPKSKTFDDFGGVGDSGFLKGDCFIKDAEKLLAGDEVFTSGKPGPSIAMKVSLGKKAGDYLEKSSYIYSFFYSSASISSSTVRISVNKSIFEEEWAKFTDNDAFDKNGNPIYKEIAGSGSSGGSNFYEGIHKGNLTSIHQFPRGLKDVKGFKNQYNEEYITQFSQGQPVTVLNMSPPSGALSASKIFIPKGTQQISLIGYYPQNTFGADGVLSTQYSAVYVLRYGSEPERNEPYTEEDLQKLFASALVPNGIASKIIETKEDTFVWHPNDGIISIISGSIPATTESNWLYILGLRGPPPANWSGGITVNNEAYLEEYKKIKWDKNGDPVDPYPISSDTSDKGKTESSTNNLYTTAKFEEKENKASYSLKKLSGSVGASDYYLKSGFKNLYTPEYINAVDHPFYPSSTSAGLNGRGAIYIEPPISTFTLFIPVGATGISISGNISGSNIDLANQGVMPFLAASFGRDEFIPLLTDKSLPVVWGAKITDVIEKGFAHAILKNVGRVDLVRGGLPASALPFWLHVTIDLPIGGSFSDIDVNVTIDKDKYTEAFDKIIWSKLNPNEPAYPYPKGATGSGSNSDGQVSGSTGTMTTSFIAGGVNRLIDNIVMAPITGQMTLDVLMNDHGLTEKVAQKILDYTFDGNALADWETILSSPDPLGYAATFYDENKDNIKLGNILNSSGSTASSGDTGSGSGSSGSSGTGSGASGSSGTSGTVTTYSEYYANMPYTEGRYTVINGRNFGIFHGASRTYITDDNKDEIGDLKTETGMNLLNKPYSWKERVQELIDSRHINFVDGTAIFFTASASNGGTVKTGDKIKVFVPPGTLRFEIKMDGRGGLYEGQTLIKAAIYKIRVKGLNPNFSDDDVPFGDISKEPDNIMSGLEAMQNGEEFWAATPENYGANTWGMGFGREVTSTTANDSSEYTTKGVWLYTKIIEVPAPYSGYSVTCKVNEKTFMQWLNNNKFFDKNGWPLEGVVHSV